MSEINELVKSSDGLTEDFKKAASNLFEEAVKKASEKLKEESDKESDKESEKEPEEKEEPEKKVEECDDSSKEKAKKDEIAEEEKEKDSEKKKVEECDDSSKEKAKKDEISEEEEEKDSEKKDEKGDDEKKELDKALKEAAERIVSLESQLEEATEQYADNLTTLQGEIENLVEARVSERLQEIEENLDVYMDYVTKEMLEQYKEAVVDRKAVELASQFMESLGAVYSKYNISNPSETELQSVRISELESQLAEANSKISEVLKDARELSEEVCDYKRIEIVNEAVKGMTDLDKSRFFSLCSTLSDVRDMDSFKKGINSLLEGFKPVMEEETSVKKIPVITEGISEQTEQPKQVVRPMTEIEALAASIQRMY